MEQLSGQTPVFSKGNALVCCFLGFFVVVVVVFCVLAEQCFDFVFIIKVIGVCESLLCKICLVYSLC